jgi:hypothetical protein
MALYTVYGMFDQIHSLLKSTKTTDEEIVRKILSGEMLENDDRFKVLRDSSKTRDRGTSIFLDEKDGEWLRDTYFGKFMQVESELLPRLRDEVILRVEQRRRGVAEIFPSS